MLLLLIFWTHDLAKCIIVINTAMTWFESFILVCGLVLLWMHHDGCCNCHIFLSCRNVWNSVLWDILLMLNHRLVKCWIKISFSSFYIIHSFLTALYFFKAYMTWWNSVVHQIYSVFPMRNSYGCVSYTNCCIECPAHWSRCLFWLVITSPLASVITLLALVHLSAALFTTLHSLLLSLLISMPCC